MSNNDPTFGSAGLHARLRHLEDQARFTLDVLDMAFNLGDFQTSINRLEEPSALLDEAVARIGELVQFSVTAFYLVDEHTSDFVLGLCRPSEEGPAIEHEVERLIETGVFALAVRENRPITVYSSDNSHRLVLSVLATTSRVRGMFIGAMPRTEKNLSGILLSLLSLILKHCANAIESFELYRLLREHERRQREFIDTLSVTVFETDPAGILRSLNRAAAAQFGLDPATLPPSAGLLDLLAPDDRPRMAAAIAETLRNGQPASLACEAMHASGATFPAVLHLAPCMHEGLCIGLRGVLGRRPEK